MENSFELTQANRIARNFRRRDPTQPRNEIAAGIFFPLLDRAGPQLQARWLWPPALLREADVRDLATRWFAVLEQIVAYTATPGAGGRTPSDLPLVALTQDDIETLETDF